MKLYAGVSAAVVLAAAFAVSGTASGQSSETAPVIISSVGAPDTDLPVNEYKAFDQFSQEHPEVVNQLGQNPNLIQSTAFLSRHAELRDLLDSNPGLRNAVAENPGDFLHLTPVAEAEVKHRWARNHDINDDNSSDSGASDSGGTGQ